MTGQTQTDPEMNDDKIQSVRMDSLSVHDNGRIRLPEDPREHFGFDVGDLVTIVLILDGERETFQKRIDSKYSVTIPARIRDEHGIEDGDRVDIEMEVPV